MGLRLNITAGNDKRVVLWLLNGLHDDGREPFPVELSEDVAVKMVSEVGTRHAVSFVVGDEGRVLLDLRGADYKIGLWGIEVTGRLNGAKWRAYGDSMIHYTPTTERGAELVTDFGDADELTLVVGYAKGFVPMRTSELTNDGNGQSPFATEKQVAENVGALQQQVAGKQDTIQDLAEIRSGAAAGASAVQVENDPTVPEWAKQPSKPTYTAQEVGALPADTPLFSGSYNDLSDKPTIPTVASPSDFDNPDATKRAKVPTVGAILDCMDPEPTPGSVKPVQSGGVVKDMFLMEFVGKGSTFVENRDTCINWIKGHTYRVYPYVTEWDWGTTLTSAKVFQLGYVITDDTKVLVADVLRGSATPTIRPYYDITLPDDGSVKSLVIAGRAASGYVVKCVVVDVTYINDVSASIQSQIDEVDKELDDIVAIQNYIDGKQINSAGGRADNPDTFISVNIPVSYGDVVVWCYSSIREKCYLSVRDAEDNRLGVFQSTGASGEGVRSLTITGDAYTDAAFIIATFFKRDGYEPSITVNGNKVWVKKDDGRLTEVEQEIGNIDAEIEKLDNKDNYRLPYQNGYLIGGNGNIYSLEGKTASTNYGWNCSSKYIPVQEGDIVTWEYGKTSSSAKGPCLVQYDSDKQYVRSIFATNGTDGVRTITIPADANFIRISWFRENIFTNTPVTIPVRVNDKEYFIDELSEVQHRVDAIAPIVTDFGVVGELYPNEIDDLTKVLTDRSDRFQFIHLSDNHNSTFASAPEMLDKTSADFIINTGDMVADKFTDSAATTLAEMQSPTKPVYTTLGNHDVYKAPTMQDVFDKFFPTMNAHNETSFDKTYYAFDVDKGGNLFKCIFLNPYDGFPDLPNTSINTIISGNMSSEQVVWFIGQLQDAATSGRHVCLFMHTVPTYYDKDSLDFFPKWRDKNQVHTTQSVSRNLEYLLDIVDAFIDGTSYEYGGTTYNFSAVGKFVAWFAGHTHCDMIGRVYEHPNQWAVNVCRPTNTQGTAYSGNTPGITWNYVTIDADIRSLCIYRVGQQQTVFGVKRDVVRVFY